MKNEYYEEVTSDDWWVASGQNDRLSISNAMGDDRKSKILNFSNNELSFLKKNNIELKLIMTGGYPQYNYNYRGETYFIYKIVDEWFYLFENWNRNNKHIYKCDQIEGLFELIKDLGK